MESGARDDSAATDAADSPRDANGASFSESRSFSNSDAGSEGSEKESPSQYRLSRMRDGNDDSDGRSSNEEVDIDAANNLFF